MSSTERVSRLPLRVALKRSIVASVAAFALLMGVLSVRMAMGNDPQLGPKLAARGQRSSSDLRSHATAPVQEGEFDDGAAVVTVPVQPSTAAPVTQPAPAPAPVQTTTS
jgi:hypothetical protein